MSMERVAVRAGESVARRSGRITGGAVARTRIAATIGLLSVSVSVVGFLIHGYPAIGASGKEIAHWAATTNQQQFAIGIYVEALGILLFLLFAAWLWTVARDAEGGPGWLSAAGFSAAALYVGISLVSNANWWAVLDAGRRGTNPQTLAAVRDFAQHAFDIGLLFGGVFFILTGYVLFRTRALPRWLGAVTAVSGLVLLIPPLQIGGVLVWVWPVVVGLYLLVRPSAVASAGEPTATAVSPTPVGTL